MTAADMTVRKALPDGFGLPPDHLYRPAVTVPEKRESEGNNLYLRFVII